MKLSDELNWRGFVHQTTLKRVEELNTKKITFYWGVDPSASSMTVGNLAIAMMLRHFINHGHHAVLLVGGATGMIGDPDGKKQERDLLSEGELEANKKAIVAQYKAIFKDAEFKIVDNLDWFKDVGYLEFLRDVGKHVPMTQMLDREFVRSRIGEGGAGISYAEFSYSLIQGYDFLYLMRNHGVTMQLCGADQWGNSIAGVDLIRKLEGKEAHVFSAPLVVNKTTGVKFGKSEDGAVWLDETKTSVFKFYQFWLNTDDETVIDLLKIYSLLSKGEITKLIELTKDHPEVRAAQKALAYDVTQTVHGSERAESVKKISEVLFGAKHFSELSIKDITELSKEVSVINASQISEALVKSGLATSNSGAMRFIQSGAVSVNGEKVDSNRDLRSIASNNGTWLLKRGKNSFTLIK
jgi:tyrosyl-tRNA synthetase